jgi:hypothetical protein
MKTAKQIFEFLPGVWKITRHILLKNQELVEASHEAYSKYVSGDATPQLFIYQKYIESQFPSERLKADGYGFFEPLKDNNDIILYSEKVDLINLYLNIRSIGTQKYQYQYDALTDSISKYFEDGSYFYTLEIIKGGAKGRHLCRSDQYTSTYCFSDDKFTLIYSVDGPHKCYKIITEYIKTAISAQ